jgi:tRNA (guanine-N7-)-methyltransferase
MSFGLSRGRTLDPGAYGISNEDLPPYDPATPETGRVDPRTFFPHSERSLEIEIGSGKGTFLVQQAGLQPDVNFLGIEWAKAFCDYAADRMRRRTLDNVRMLRADATEFIRWRCPDAIADVIHVYFSDPWPKKRHHKRRVVQDRTLREFHRILREGGRVHLVTDHDDLWGWYEDHVARCADLFERVAFRAPESARPGELIGTNFERKYQREGRPFHAMRLLRRSAST